MGSTTSALEIPIRRSLTPLQRRLAAAQLRQPENPALNMALCIRFDQVEIPRLVRAFSQVVEASDVLRMRIDPRHPDRALIQPAGAGTTPGTTVVPEIAPTNGMDWASSIARRTIDLSIAPYTSTIADHGDGSATWALVVHHLATDATASSLIVERTVACYLGEQPSPSEFFRWFGDAHDREPGSPLVPSDRQSRTFGTGASERVPLTASSVDVVEQACESTHRLLTPDLSRTAIFVTAVVAMLASGDAEEISVGVPVHHRTDSTADLIGPTLNMHSVRVPVSRLATGRDLHRAVSRELFTTLRNASPTADSPSDYEVVVNVIPRASVSPPPGLEFDVQWLHPDAIDPDHQFRVQATAYGGGAAAVALDVARSAADPAQLTGRFERALRHVIEHGDHPAMDFERHSPSELAAIVESETTTPAATAGPLVLDLEACLADKTHIAVRDGDRVFTAAELWSWVERGAAALAAETAPSARIGIELNRSVEAVVAILAAVRAGRSFVPIDPEHPARHKENLRRLAAIDSTIESASHVNRWSTDEAGDLPEPNLDPRAEAYLLFTSGSTGEPKGVPISAQGLADYIGYARSTYFEDGVTPIAPLFTPLTFDLTITTLFAPLLCGGELRVVRPSGGQGLIEVARMTEANWAKATPSHLAALLPLLDDDHQLRTLIVGGEALGSGLCDDLFTQLPELVIFNEYGPTEAVVGCCVERLDRTQLEPGPVAIGRPIPGVELRIVSFVDDEQMIRCGFGEPGELLIATDRLTAGYLGGREADRFIHHGATRFYRSGDRVVRSHDGRLTFLGRNDDELKVNGIRLDPAIVESALESHPSIARAIVRLWSPESNQATRNCVRCGLPDTVPAVEFDADGVCNRCHEFDRVASAASAWFGSETDLVEYQQRWDQRRQGDYDCVFLLSGGKDSTFALYKLVELGFTPYAITYDNEYISDQAKRNVETAVADLGVDHEYVRSEHTKAILRESLRVHADVCHGCYKTLYTLAATRARELGAPGIVTGLSRGQLFETRLLPGQFESDRFDPEAIDRAVVEARKRYHRTPDFTNQVLDTSVFSDDAFFEQVEYVDIYRYLDVELAAVLEYLEEQTPWERPADTGRSSNCLVNVAGIHVHQIERGWHNYAEPYAWDVRLGHKQRDEALEELDDPMDPDEIATLLGELAYRPRPLRTLTAWFVTEPSRRAPTPAELHQFLAGRLPAWALPPSYVHVDEMPLTSHGKVDTEQLPTPARTNRAARGAVVSAESELEQDIAQRWRALLDLQEVGIDDDFFALGGDSLAAISFILSLSRSLGVELREELAFQHTTIRELAEVIQSLDLTETVPSPTISSPTRADRATEDPPPFSPAEQSLLFEHRADPDSTRFNVARRHEVPTVVDAAQLTAALQTVVARHECFSWSYGWPRHQLDPDAAVVVSSLSRDEESIDRFVREPFDLETGPLLRCAVIPNGTGTTVLLVLHHVSGDHRTLDVVWDELDTAYRGAPLPAQPYDHSDLVQWQQENATRHRSYWAGQQSWPRPPDFSRTALAATPDAKLESESDGYLEHATDLSREDLVYGIDGSSPAAVLAAAAAAILPWCDDEVELCLVASTRDHADAHDICGYLLNPLPLRFPGSSDQSLAELLAAANSQLGAALPHRTVAFSEIVAESRQEKFQPPSGSVLVSFIDDPALQFDGQSVDHQMIFNGGSVSDLSFFLDVSSDRVVLGTEYSGSRVGRDLATQIDGRFNQALRWLHESPSRPVSDLAAAGNTSLLVGPEVVSSDSVLDGLFDRVAAASDRRAVIANGQELTWHQVLMRSRQLANALTRGGVGQHDAVLVDLERSVHLPVAVLAVLLIGAVYVPVDPHHNQARRDDTRRLSAARFVITNSTRADADEELRSFRLDDDGVDGARFKADGPALRSPTLTADDPAYMIFTSGSTGEPNGVTITHGQIAASTAARSERYATSPERFLMISSIAFDSSMVGLFWTLATGGTLVLPSDETATDPDALIELIEQANPDYLLGVPTLYGVMLERSVDSQAWPSNVIVAGERCPRELVQRHFDRWPNATLTNEYGPTEATVWATSHACEPDQLGPVSIGAPIPGLGLAVIDSNDNLVPTGVTGELVLFGPNVAAGYVGSAEADSRFAPLAPNGSAAASCPGRVFRTRDRAQIQDGTVFFLGRVDEQLSVAGLRIEPGEIESALYTIPGVRAAAIVATDPRSIDELIAAADPIEVAATLRAAASSPSPATILREELTRLNPPVRPLIIAHVEANDFSESHARSHLQTRLPTAAVPNRFVRSDALPRGATGKIDRALLRDLPLPPPASVAPQADPGSTVAAQQVAQIFGEVLGHTDVGPDQSFFDLGGDSLRAFEVIRRLEHARGHSVPVRAIHDAPTPRQLGAALDRSETGADRSSIMTLGVGSTSTEPATYFLHYVGNNADIARAVGESLGADHSMTAMFDANTVFGPSDVLRGEARAVPIMSTVQGYADEIALRSPEDAPVLLIGYCQGGIFAHEVAVELTRRGRSVPLVLTIHDWHAPDIEFPEMSTFALFKMAAQQANNTLLRQFVSAMKRGTPANYVKSRFRVLVGKVSSRISSRNSFAEVQALSAEINRAFDEHQYTPYDGRVLLVRSSSSPLTPESLGDAGWASVLSNYRVVYQLGNPILQPAVNDLAAIIKQEYAIAVGDALPD